MRTRFVLPVAVLVAGLSGCGGGSSSSAAHSSAVRSSDIAAVAAQPSSPAGTAKPSSAKTGAPTPVKSAPAAPLVDARGNPIIPAAARAHTDAGAIAFTKYYWALLDHLDQHPHRGVVMKVSSAGCEVCLRVDADQANLLKNDGHMEGNSSDLTKFHLAWNADHGRVLVSFALHISKSTYKSRGHHDEVEAAGNFTTSAALEWTGMGWSMLSFGSK